MPTYEFRCGDCGCFEETRRLSEAGTSARCPGCAAPSRRVYTAPGFSVRSGALRDASTGTRRVMDRAQSGEPVVTGGLSGRRLPTGGHAH